MKHRIIVLAAVFSFAWAQPGRSDELKKVLVIGDSISIGYFSTVKEALKGKAEVHHNPGNARYSQWGVNHLDQWLGDTNWDVIHFNFGLWDIYGWSQKPRQTAGGYEKNLDLLVQRLKKTGARLIYATTTPVCPAPERTAKITIHAEYAKAFADAEKRVMKKHAIPVNDLHALIAPDLDKYARGKNDVHYTRDGQKRLGTRVAEQIRAAL